MCAFITGHIGDCEVGEEYQKMYFEKYKQPINGVVNFPDDNGCYRPVEIYETPNVYNNGLGFEYVDGEEKIALQKYKEYVKNDNEKRINTIESYRGENFLTWTDDAIDREIKRLKDKIEESQQLSEPHKYPAFQSVLIHFSCKPKSEVIELMKNRATEFAENHYEELKIKGFRLLEIVKTYNYTHL